MPAPPKKLIITGDRKKPRVADTVDRALSFLERHAEVVSVDLDATEPLESTEADLVLVFGGDGAILKAARRLGTNKAPLCGVNLGKLGFLASLSDSNLDAELRPILAGEYAVTEAVTFDCTTMRNGTVVRRSRAVNDAVISRGALSRIIPVSVSLDGDTIATYHGDGVIVSTPLGSTAHSLSAGGPIVEPSLEAFILTPICPHTLSNRPIVVPASNRIELEVGGTPQQSALTTDGQVFLELTQGDRVVITLSEQRLVLVRSSNYNYYRLLREKLGWSGRFGDESGRTDT